jgi:DNA invertase Pin-like site-specific DNA recombinase
MINIMLKAYGYCRVSGAGQIDGNGFERQRNAIQAFALKSKIEIVHIYFEQVSGVKDEEQREVFQEMISAILRNGVRTIVVEGLDRLAREYRVQEQLLIYLVSKGITLIDARTGENVTEAISADPMKRAMVQIAGIFSELEKNLLVKKLRLARESKRKAAGKCEGRKGWDDQPNKRDAILGQIRTLRRKPKYQKRLTYVEVANQLNELAKNDDIYSTITEKEWNGSMVQNFIQRYDKK